MNNITAMLRFMVLSLAMHGLAIGAWYYQEAEPAEFSSGRTLTLALLPPAAAALGGNLEAQVEHNRLNTSPAAEQARPPGPDRMRAPEKLTVPVAADRQQQMHAGARHRTAAAPGTTVETPETVARDVADPAVAATTPAAGKVLARHAIQTAVSTALKANFRYPRIARRNGWQGTVILALRVLPDGQLTDILVSSSSGHPVLDLAAMHTLQTATVPQARQWLDDQAMDLVLPVEYRLLEG
jgi:TonB family protein